MFRVKNNNVFYAFGPPTCLPCVKEVWQRDTKVSWQRKCLPEVPNSPPTVLPANLWTIMSAQRKTNSTATTNKKKKFHLLFWSCQRFNKTNHFLPCRILQLHLESPFVAEWLLLRLL